MVAPRFLILLIGWLADTMWNLSVGSARLLAAFPRRIHVKIGFHLIYEKEEVPRRDQCYDGYNRCMRSLSLFSAI